MRLRPVITRSLPILLLALALLAGCAPREAGTPVALATAPVTDTPAPTATAIPSPTATATAEPTATETPPPTATPVPPLALSLEESLFWCLPLDYAFPSSAAELTGAIPAEAREGTLKDGTLNLQVPAISCTLVFAFNQPVPAGVRFELAYELAPDSPWLSTELAPVAGRPNLAAVTLAHDYIVNHPYWEIFYPAAVKSADGALLWSAPARFFKATPNLCWDGSLPDPVTLYCPSTDGDWNYKDFPNFNPTADVFK